MLSRTVSICVVSVFLSACAKQPDQIVATYVSPNTFAGMSCSQIVSENNRVIAQVNTLTAAQKKAADNDALLTGVGAIIFWPALLALPAGADNEAQLASLKGTYDALQSAGTAKGCF